MKKKFLTALMAAALCMSGCGSTGEATITIDTSKSSEEKTHEESAAETTDTLEGTISAEWNGELSQGSVLSLEQITQALENMEYYYVFAIKSGEEYTILSAYIDDIDYLSPLRSVIVGLDYQAGWTGQCNGGYSFNAGDYYSLSGNDELVYFGSSSFVSWANICSIANIYQAFPSLFIVEDDVIKISNFGYDIDSFRKSMLLNGNDELSCFDKIDEFIGVESLNEHFIDEFSTRDVNVSNDSKLLKYPHYVYNSDGESSVSLGYMDGTKYETATYKTVYFLEWRRTSDESEIGETTKMGYYRIGTADEIKSFYGQDGFFIGVGYAIGGRGVEGIVYVN